MSLPAELVRAVDGARGDVPRSKWVRRALEAALGDTPVPSPETGRSESRGREAELDAVRERPAARAASPQRAAGLASPPASCASGRGASDVRLAPVGDVLKESWDVDAELAAMEAEARAGPASASRASAFRKATQ